ncbi:hypothetical protein A2763_02415 [Candidatus Kaiserbacteria bacterium RIFCSPHIGHO2_01_FULL_54_36]|uniref:Phosphatidic acid phosphatase type 2/haloperoxidase domain-containing protein n=1 Tax=Candidatus Kaiserbacteria bacterium RIFCSPHIGHO2_01_FULL_54_36 TaxID=1798482 RepID=A0A1F6CNQ1_9BACT|nr:MAG: hypothetical protein A2763_02415 [Candidatus Kaiserbacteria bacterium RIFCSPHIGHO2_01_FULL_54_36]OGG76013.1 MAG: hypothetical protein A3A41_03520 [Candidatus Kaiserbacteria bacterium RIFCSPLOWO2_01_FULL_54_22]
MTALDISILEALEAMRNALSIDIFIGITELGEALLIGGLALCLCLVFFLQRKYAYLTGLFISVVLTGSLVLMIKELVQRARPEHLYRAYTEAGYSFPSAHAALSVAFYGFCMYLVYRTVPPGMWRTLAMAGLTLMIAGIGFSRVYLGVHYPSDVIAGLALGAFCAWVGVMVVQKIERR